VAITLPCLPGKPIIRTINSIKQTTRGRRIGIVAAGNKKKLAARESRYMIKRLNDCSSGAKLNKQYKNKTNNDDSMMAQYTMIMTIDETACHAA
jgi:hypothetical protein